MVAVKNRKISIINHLCLNFRGMINHLAKDIIDGSDNHKCRNKVNTLHGKPTKSLYTCFPMP